MSTPAPPPEIGYEGLLPAQQARFNELMAMPADDWPLSLQAHCTEFAAQRGHGKCGDVLAEAVGFWVKAQRG